MKISEILPVVNTFEKNHFLRVVEHLISTGPKRQKKVEEILNGIDGQIKNADNLSVESVFNLISEEYVTHIKCEFGNASNQLDIAVDILIRDGNSLMSREWLMKLYEKEIRQIRDKIKSFDAVIEAEEDPRTRDYRIYRKCIAEAYTNDLKNNRDERVTGDEQSVLNALIEGLELSHEEVKLINYSVVPLKKMDIDELIAYLVRCGILFYSKKNHQLYVPDEVIEALRTIRGKEIPDKVFKRILKQLKASQINLIARKHNIEYKLDTAEKINEIIQEGISFTKVIGSAIHKPGSTKTEKRKVIVDLIENKLKIEERIGGASLEDKITSLIEYVNRKDREDSISISVHGYDKLLSDLHQSIPDFAAKIKQEFELQDSVQLKAPTLLLYNLKPLDILYVMTDEEIKGFCEAVKVSTRGDEINNILESYKDIKNLYLENYLHISNRDLNALKANNISIKESELGVQYESLTKDLFRKLKLNVDDSLRSKLNTAKDKIDILINLGNDDVIIVECKTKKDTRFNTYSSASRQIKAYKELAEKKGLKVVKTFIIASSFGDDFVNECGLDYDLNLSLMTSESLLEIYTAFQETNLSEFPYKILLRDVLINSDRVVRSITK